MRTRLNFRVYVSGGEPTLMPHLAALLMEIKALGFAVKPYHGTALRYWAASSKNGGLWCLRRKLPANTRQPAGGALTELVRERYGCCRALACLMSCTTAVPGLVELTDIQVWRVAQASDAMFSSSFAGKTLDPEYRWRNPYDQTWFGLAAALAQGWADEVIVREFRRY